MVRLFAVAAAAIAALVSTQSAEAGVVTYPKGVYYRPSGPEVSGRVGATTLYTRSPCPALNSMANHGLIPRDGKGLTRDILHAAVMDVFNIDQGLADIMASLAPEGTFDLATLSTHNLIEHDVSLTRRDVYYGGDQSQADPLYIAEILAYTFGDILAFKVPELSLKDVAKIRSNRITECKNKNPQCDFGGQQQFIANAESGLLLRGLGGKNTEVVPAENVFSFLVREQFPSDFVKPSTPISFAQITNTSNALIALQVAP